MTAVPSRAPGRLVFDRAPLRVYWELTRACELACRHCRAEAVQFRHPGELDTAEGLQLLERLASFGDPKPHLVLTGGDPLKRPDLYVLIEAARALGLGVSVAPSATPLLTPPEIRRLKEAGVEAISLSLDGSTAARHDALRGIRGTFERTLAAARTAQAVGLPFQINTLVADETLDDLPAIYLLASELHAARWSLFFLVSVGRGTVLEQVSPEEAEALMRWLVELSGQPGGGGLVVTTTEAPHFRRVLLQRRGPAVRGHGAGIRDGNGIMFISHTGEVHPSGFLPLSAGNVRTQDVLEIYRGSHLFRTLRHADLFDGRCGRCEYHWQCGGSRARAYAATGDPFGEDPLCGYQPKKFPPALP
ncbi:MAG TPA: radical SAM protein [Gemmatimonadales bacterium]|nr:radical SAM protein [Gemmatimonadales bacterium]